MKSKTSLWLICKTHTSLKFGSSCIIIAHFSSCPFFPCQAFQAGFPYAPVKTGNCFKRLKHLYFFFFPFLPQLFEDVCVQKKRNQQISAIERRGERESFLPPACQVIALCLCSTDFLYTWKLQVPRHHLAQGTGGFQPTGIGEGQRCFPHCLIKVCLSTQLSVLPGWTKCFRPRSPGFTMGR